MRICFFGDSFVNGTGDDDALGWVGRLVAAARRGGHDVTSYNLGIRRDTSADVEARWLGEARLRLPAGSDGRLVFSFGANDCASNGVDGQPRISRAQSLVHAETILQGALPWLPTLMVGPGVIADDAEATGRICALSSDYAALCERVGVPYLDISRIILASLIWSEEALRADGSHPNRGGYGAVADAVSGWAAWRACSRFHQAIDIVQFTCPKCRTDSTARIEHGQISLGYIYGAGGPHYCAMVDIRVDGLRAWREGDDLGGDLDDAAWTIRATKNA